VPASNAPIRLESADTASGNFCSLEFKVKVESLADPESEDSIIQFSVLSGDDAKCDGISAGVLEEDSLTVEIVNPNAVFWVTKDFSDDNKSPVDVHIQCDTGIYTNPDFQITDPAANGTFDTVGFVVYGIPSTGANCWVYEKPVPNGYIDGYAASAGLNAIYSDLYAVNKGDKTDEKRGCYYKAVKSGEYFCAVTDDAKPGMFTVNKEWVIINEGGNPVKEKADVTITCDSPITEVMPDPETPPAAQPQEVVSSYSISGELGDDESLSVWVETLTGPAKCKATEDIKDSSVESTDNCGERSIPAGGKSECTFVNTVFFEGIPSLNQYGIALMALLMLGLGVLGVRRFA
jgi:hypothetical protein